MLCFSLFSIILMTRTESMSEEIDLHSYKSNTDKEQFLKLKRRLDIQNNLQEINNLEDFTKLIAEMVTSKTIFDNNIDFLCCLFFYKPTESINKISLIDIFEVFVNYFKIEHYEMLKKRLDTLYYTIDILSTSFVPSIPEITVSISANRIYLSSNGNLLTNNLSNLLFYNRKLNPFYYFVVLNSYKINSNYDKLSLYANKLENSEDNTDHLIYKNLYISNLFLMFSIFLDICEVYINGANTLCFFIEMLKILKNTDEASEEYKNMSLFIISVKDKIIICHKIKKLTIYLYAEDQIQKFIKKEHINLLKKIESLEEISVHSSSSSSSCREQIKNLFKDFENVTFYFPNLD